MDLTEYPKISIVTPVFNQVKYLEKTILSVLNQNYPNLEYIIIDGGSTDGTIDIIKKYESQLTYWVSEPDNGMYDAIQKGFDHSTGELMGWLNADDLFFHRALFAIAQVFLENKEVNWITSHHTVIDEGGTIIFNEPSTLFCKYDFYMPSKGWHGSEIGQESTFWRRSLWKKAGARMCTSLKLAGDFELWIRFFQYDKLYVVNTLFSMFRARKGQLSSNTTEYYEETDNVIQMYPLSNDERNMMNKYLRRLRIAHIINRLKILNGTKLVMLQRFRQKWFYLPKTLFLSNWSSSD